MKIRKYIWLMIVPTAMLAGCYNYDAYEVVSSQPVSVELAYAFSSSDGSRTRQPDDVVKNDLPVPRIPTTYDLRLIPLADNTPKISDLSLLGPEFKSKDSENPSSGLYYSRYCDLVEGVNGFLVYGGVANRPVTSGFDTKMYNGSLKAVFPQTIESTNDIKDGISFSLEPIYKGSDYTTTNGIPTEASALAECLNKITRAGGWNELTNDYLTGLLTTFTNNEKSLPGSAASVKKLISALIALIDTYNGGDESVSSTLATIKTEAQNQLNAIGNITTTSYPRNMNLPDGAAVLRWAEVVENNVTTKKFVPQINSTNLNNINSVDLFTYPAPLYYFIDSDIRTSNQKVDFASIYSGVTTDATKTAWDKILERDEFNDIESNSVTLNTRSVALIKPVQYAVAQLKVKIRAASTSLSDATPKSIAVDNNKFLLTGIIVCDQRPVDYKFDQKTIEQGSTSDDDVSFIYDNNVKSNCYLTYQDATTWIEACNTLVLQSQEGEDVHIVLEFENNSGEDFTCVDGVVYNGTRFYLIGKVEVSRYNTPDGNVNTENKTQVFTKDYITTVNMTVSSLAKAYNVPPNLLSNNLEIGVMTTPQWTASTPTVIRLE